MGFTPSFNQLRQAFRCIFTKPSFASFVAMLTGWVLSHRHRYVTDLILTGGSTSRGHFSSYHGFFSRYVRNLDHLSRVSAKLSVSIFASKGTVFLTPDDTFCGKRRLAVYGTDGVGALQPDCRPVSSERPSPSTIPRSALVPAERRSLVRRHAHHAAAAKL
ncbi:MAG TPA: hypothetical protein EYH34_15155 [Planctomycetes bacterium]|nr:hypothetical protein [Planctomycetota bacterium]